MKTPPRRWLAALGALAIAGAGAALAARPAVSVPHLAGQWRVTAIERDPPRRAVATHSLLVIRNTGSRPIPRGWTLWYTAIGGSATADPAYPVRRVVGSLFSVGSSAGLPELAPGAEISIPLTHPGEVPRDDKGPSAPYAVLPGAPGKGIALDSYTVSGVRRDTPGAGTELFGDPAAAYARNLAWSGIDPARIPPVLPSPRHWQRTGTAFAARGLATPQGAASLGEAVRLARSLPGVGAGRLPFTIAIDPALAAGSPEAYRLVIDPRAGVQLAGASPGGLFYGLQTLDQLLFAARRRDGHLRLQPLTIEDAPRFAYRGLMIDIARNFRSPAELRAVIDLMARFKLNRLHLHLTDDEAWRIAIPALPELAGVAGRRGHSDGWADRLPPAHGSGPDAGRTPGSGFLSGADYIALLRYAHASNVEIVPEVDMPGHSRAAIQAMKARAARRPDEHGRYLLSDPADASLYESAQGYTDNALDPGLPSADAFVEVVVAELARLHRASGVPLKVMHIGADEVPAGAWERSPAARARIAKLGGGGKAVLWNDWLERVDGILQRHGIAAMGWEELGLVSGAPGIEPNPRFASRAMTVEVWNTLPGSEGLANRLANAGYPVVLAPATRLYFDMAQAADPEEPGHDWANVLPLADVFGYDPLAPVDGAPELSAAGRANIAGIEGTLFSETVTTNRRLEYMLMPRLLALAERAWAPQPGWAANGDAAARIADWGLFSSQLGLAVLPYVEARFPALTYHLPPPGAIVRNGMVQANYAWPGMTLHFTRDGSAPTSRSPVLQDQIRSGGPIRIVAVSGTGRTSPDVLIAPNP